MNNIELFEAVNLDDPVCISSQWNPISAKERINRFWLQKQDKYFTYEEDTVKQAIYLNLSNKHIEGNIPIFYIDYQGLHLCDHILPDSYFPYKVEPVYNKENVDNSCASTRIHVINEHKEEKAKGEMIIKGNQKFSFFLYSNKDRISLRCKKESTQDISSIVGINKDGLFLFHSMNQESVPFPLNSLGQILWV